MDSQLATCAASAAADEAKTGLEKSKSSDSISQVPKLDSPAARMKLYLEQEI